MSRALQKYLDRVMIYANRNEKDAAQIRAELEDHLLKKIADLEESGLSREDAVFGAIEEHGHPRTVGYGLRKRFSWVDVRTHGTARGFVAVGPKAVGIIAMGGVAFGLFAFGGLAVGLITFGGLALAALFSFGGLSAAVFGYAYGGFALGLVAVGGFACGLIATGGMAIGLIVPQAGTSIAPQNSSLYTQYLQDSFLMSRQITVISTFLFWGTLVILILTYLVLTKMEYHRINRADPKLVD
ncbi:MAG: hypothetical protein JSW23_05360 [Planctomycetota bacterium]|nr:MAG: hypothetical protein JSW23_05360 [Planctomycetota bacterium]